MIIPSNKVFIHWHTDSSGTDWGWKVGAKWPSLRMRAASALVKKATVCVFSHCC